MTYPSEVIATSCDGRVHSRPKQFEDMSVDEQSRYCGEYADISCKDCFGNGGHIHTDTFDNGYFLTSEEYFEPCECVSIFN
jgi:hypothetical protein